MYTTFDVNANELSSDFVEAIKLSYKDKNIQIVVYEIDETEYLLSSAKNRAELHKRVDDVENEKNLVEKTIGEL